MSSKLKQTKSIENIEYMIMTKILNKNFKKNIEDMLTKNKLNIKLTINDFTEINSNIENIFEKINKKSFHAFQKIHKRRGKRSNKRGGSKRSKKGKRIGGKLRKTRRTKIRMGGEGTPEGTSEDDAWDIAQPPPRDSRPYLIMGFLFLLVFLQIITTQESNLDAIIIQLKLLLGTMSVLGFAQLAGEWMDTQAFSDNMTVAGETLETQKTRVKEFIEEQITKLTGGKTLDEIYNETLEDFVYNLFGS